MRSLGSALIRQDGHPDKGIWMQREDYMKTRGEDDHLQDQERGLSVRNQPSRREAFP